MKAKGVNKNHESKNLVGGLQLLSRSSKKF
jgi:hypothetical protein